MATKKKLTTKRKRRIVGALDVNRPADLKRIVSALYQTANSELGLCPHDALYALLYAANLLDSSIIMRSGRISLFAYGVAVVTTGAPWAAHCVVQAHSEREDAELARLEAEAREQMKPQPPTAKSDPSLN